MTSFANFKFRGSTQFYQIMPNFYRPHAVSVYRIYRKILQVNSFWSQKSSYIHLGVKKSDNLQYDTYAGLLGQLSHQPSDGFVKL